MKFRKSWKKSFITLSPGQSHLLQLPDIPSLLGQNEVVCPEIPGMATNMRKVFSKTGMRPNADIDVIGNNYFFSKLDHFREVERGVNNCKMAQITES
jgi:hypothetical protein